MALALASTTTFSSVTLSGDAQPVDFTRFFRSPLRPGPHIACRAQTAAQRSVTAALIDDAVAHTDRTVLLLAQGVGCAAVAWWARLSPRFYVERVGGALLIDPDGSATASEAFASPRSALPFPSLVVGTDDAARRLSGEWGSRLLDTPAIESAGPQGRSLRTMVLRFTAAVVENDLARAERLSAAVS